MTPNAANAPNKPAPPGASRTRRPAATTSAGAACRSRGSPSTTSPRSSSPATAACSTSSPAPPLDLAPPATTAPASNASPRACWPKPRPPSSTASTPRRSPTPPTRSACPPPRANGSHACPPGVALWVVGGRCFEVRHLLSDREWELDRHRRGDGRPTSTRRPRDRAGAVGARRARRGAAMNGAEHRGGGDIAALAWSRWCSPRRSRSCCSPAAIAGVLADGHPIAARASAARSACSCACPATLAHPALAWPGQTRRALPGSCAVQVELDVTIAARARRCRARLLARAWRGTSHRRDRGRAARWASDGELAELHVRGPQPGRITLGEHSRPADRSRTPGVGARRRARAVGQEHRADRARDPRVAGTGALDLDQSRRRPRHPRRPRQRRRGLHLRPDRHAPGSQHTPWSPIAAAHTWEGARRTAANLLGVGDQAPRRSADETLLEARRRALPRAAAARRRARRADDARRPALGRRASNEDEPDRAAQRAARTPAPWPALRRCARCGTADHRLRSSLMQTIATSLDAWQEPAIAAATVGREPDQRRNGCSPAQTRCT